MNGINSSITNNKKDVSKIRNERETVEEDSEKRHRLAKRTGGEQDSTGRNT